MSAVWCHGGGRLEGTIRDGSQAVVPDASILCVPEDTVFRFHVQSDHDGNYMLIAPDGAYNIIVRHAGFNSDARIGVRVPPEGTLRVDFELRPSRIGETITVTDVAAITEILDAE